MVTEIAMALTVRAALLSTHQGPLVAALDPVAEAILAVALALTPRLEAVAVAHLMRAEAPVSALDHPCPLVVVT